MIVLSNGEKFNPLTMEIIIEGHPLISKVVVVNQSRFQAGLLVEPNLNMPEMDSEAFHRIHLADSIDRKPDHRPP